jgi:hypothetical protein
LNEYGTDIMRRRQKILAKLCSNLRSSDANKTG